MNKEAIQCESKCHFHEHVLTLRKPVNESNRSSFLLNSHVMDSSDVVIASRVRLGFRGNVRSFNVDAIGEDEFAFVETLKNVQLELHVVDVVEVYVRRGVELLAHVELESFHLFNDLIKERLVGELNKLSWFFDYFRHYLIILLE